MGERRQKSETVTREYTINLHKLLHKRRLYVRVIEESERASAVVREGARAFSSSIARTLRLVGGRWIGR